MTREEFLSELKECGPWRLESPYWSIRHCNSGLCPLVHISNTKFNTSLTNNTPSLAGDSIKLPNEDIGDIILAADNNNFAGGKETRRQLLEACGL